MMNWVVCQTPDRARQTLTDRASVERFCDRFIYLLTELIVSDAACFFFPPNTRYLALTEVRLNDKNGKSAGNIDMVLVALDSNDHIIDFGALEVQAVYVSGNVKEAL